MWFGWYWHSPTWLKRKQRSMERRKKKELRYILPENIVKTYNVVHSSPHKTYSLFFILIPAFYVSQELLFETRVYVVWVMIKHMPYTHKQAQTKQAQKGSMRTFAANAKFWFSIFIERKHLWRMQLPHFLTKIWVCHFCKLLQQALNLVLRNTFQSFVLLKHFYSLASVFFFFASFQRKIVSHFWCLVA